MANLKIIFSEGQPVIINTEDIGQNGRISLNENIDSTIFSINSESVLVLKDIYYSLIDKKITEISLLEAESEIFKVTVDNYPEINWNINISFKYYQEILTITCNK